LESDENASNVDMKFYVFGGQAVLRMYFHGRWHQYKE